MGADRANGVLEYNRRPPQRPWLERIKYAVWDPEERKFLGRTPHRWGVIGLIYLVMYICIIIFFSLCMCGLMATMDDRIPYFTLADSIIGDNPGMGHRPLLFEEGSLIWYNYKNDTLIKKYVDNINGFLAPYENKTLLLNQGLNQLECGDIKPPRDEVCAFNTSLLGPCSKENGYGYKNRTPCVIVKLNRLYAWNPDFYDDPGDLPSNMPPDLREYILNATDQERRKVWITCAGERPADTEALGPVKYYPYPGLKETFFPYDNTPGYLSPLVAVQFLNPASIVLLFYGIFYAVLAAMFAACMAGLFYVLEEDKPKFILDGSLIGVNPGVTYRPLPSDDGFIIKYHVRSQNQTLTYIEQLEKFFHDYKSERWYMEKTECVAADNFGFPNTPCVFVKVNKIYGWQPLYYDVNNLPADMDGELKQFIREQTPQEQKRVWVSCWDEHGNSTGVEYPWGRALPDGDFPYRNAPGYLNPVLAVRLTPEAATLSTIRCRAWAKNIIYNKSIKEGTGYARIQLQVDFDNSTAPAE